MISIIKFITEQSEVWRYVRDYDKKYKVSNLGNVYSLKSNKILKPRRNSKGYYQVGLMKDGKEHKHLTHRLIASHFLKNKNNYTTVDHRDYNRINNILKNLIWLEANKNVRGKRRL